MNPEGNIITPEKNQEIQFPVSLRDYFAAAALQGMCADPGRNGSFEFYADGAYAYADAMLIWRQRVAENP